MSSLVENEQQLKTNANSSVSLCKDQVKEFVKRYSDKHKDLHANISKIGKVIDKVISIFSLKIDDNLTNSGV